MTRKRLGELLVEAGLLGVAQLESALAHQQQWGGRLGRIVVQMGFTPEPRMLRILAGHLGVPLADPPADDLHPRILDQIPADLAARWMVFPLAMRRDVAGEALVVAMSDPTSVEAVDAIRQHTGRIVYVALAGDTQIEAWIRKHYFGEGRRPPSDTAIPLITGALATPAPQPSPIVTPAANPFASAIVQPLTVDDPFSVLDLKPVEVPGSRTSAGMVGLAELQPISANTDVVDLEPIPAAGWSPSSPPAAPVFDTSGGFLSSDDDDPGALPPPNPFAAPSFEAPPSFSAPPVIEAPSFAAPAPAAPSFAGPTSTPPRPPAPAIGDDPFGAFPSTIALVEMPAPHAAGAPPPPASSPALATSWADALAPSPPTPAPELPPPTTAAPATSTCPRCTSPRVDGARFCPFCGLSFVAAPAAAPAPPPSPPPASAPAAALPALATSVVDIPVSAEAMPTPIATGVLILDDDVVESAMARRGTPMPMPSLAVIHALDAIAAEGPPPPSPFDALAAPAPGDARTDAIAVALPDTAPLGEPVSDATIEPPVEPTAEPLVVTEPIVATAPAIDAATAALPLEAVAADDGAATHEGANDDVGGDEVMLDVVALPTPPDAAAPPPVDPTLQTLELSIIEDLPEAPVALDVAPAPALPDPVSATSVGLTLVAIDEPPAAGDALSLEPLPATVDVAARSAWDEQPMAPPVAASSAWDEQPMAPPVAASSAWDEQPMAQVALDPATATSIGLTLVAVEPPAEPGAPVADADLAPAVPTADPATATSVGLTLVAIPDESAGSDVDDLDVDMDVAMDVATDGAMGVEVDVAMDVGVDAAAEASAADDAMGTGAPTGADDVASADDVAGADDVDAAGSPLVSQWADAAERPIPRQETDTRNALGWIPPSREILVVPEEAGPAPEPVQAYAPVAAPKSPKPAAPWARFAPKAAAAPEPAPAAPATVEPDVMPTLELAQPTPDDEAGATLEMARPLTAEAVEPPTPEPPSAGLEPALLARTADVDGEPALPTEPWARPVLADDARGDLADEVLADDVVLDTATLARPDVAGPGTDVDGDAILPTLQMTAPPAGLMADGGGVDVVEAVDPVEPWSLSEPGRMELDALPPPLPAAPSADPWVVSATEVASVSAGSEVAPSPPTPPPTTPTSTTTTAEDEVAELAPWPGSPGAADGPPPMKLTPTMVMRMDPSEQRKLLALLLEKANVGPEVLAKPGDPDKPSS